MANKYVIHNQQKYFHLWSSLLLKNWIFSYRCKKNTYVIHFLSFCKNYTMCKYLVIVNVIVFTYVKDLIVISYFLFLTNYTQYIIGQKAKGIYYLSEMVQTSSFDHLTINILSESYHTIFISNNEFIRH